MADLERMRRVEHAHETKHLSYGHFGTATYDHESRHAWRFLRQDGDATGNGPPRDETRSSAPTSRFRLLHQRVAKAYERPQGIDEIDSERIQSRRPVHAYQQWPELGFVFPDLLDGQVGIEVALSRGDAALRGQVLNCGQAFGLDIRGHRQGLAGAAIVARPDGVAQENLWISSIGTDSVTVDDGSGFDSTMSVPITGNHGLQHNLASAEPILQVCFTEHSSAVGIRKASSLTLLRVLWLGGSQEPLMSSASTAAVRIDEILVLPMSRTGGYPHAHLAFNPRNESQLAIVDVHGVWGLWSLTDKGKYSTKVSCHAHLSSSSRLLPHGSLQANRSSLDGWHRICWLNSKHEPGKDLLLACSRQVAAVFSVSGEMLGEVDMRIGVKTAKHCVLDVQSCIAHPDICFVLTSTRILVLRLAKDVLETEVHREPLNLMCSWDHFRGQQDSTLRMSVLELTNKSRGSLDTGTTTTVVHLFVFSRQNMEVTRYTLTTTGNALQRARTVSVSEPCSFSLPEGILKRHSPISDLVFTLASSDGHISGSHRSERGAFVMLFARMEDSAIFEAVYEYSELHGFENFHAEPGLCLPIRAKKQPQHIASSKYVDDDDDMDDFVMEDPYNELANGDSRQDLERDERKSVKFERHKTRAWADVLPGRAVDDADADFNTVLDILSLALSDEVANASRLLVEKIPTARIDDVEEASEAIADWINDTSTSESPVDQARLRPTSILANSSRSLLEEYNDLIDGYVESLPAAIPDRLRVKTERLVREASLKKLLASYALRQKRHEEAKTSEDGLVTEAIGQRHIEESPVSRLSIYTAINKTQSHAFYTKTMTEVLGHLPVDINTDPSDYSYKDAELQLAMARNRVDTDLDPKTKRDAEKLVRYEKKRLERERRQAEDIALQNVMMPNKVMSSQLLQTGSSQLGGSQVIVATQPERGAFGARQRVPKAGKKRVAGF